MLVGLMLKMLLSRYENYPTLRLLPSHAEPKQVRQVIHICKCMRSNARKTFNFHGKLFIGDQAFPKITPRDAQNLCPSSRYQSGLFLEMEKGDWVNFLCKPRIPILTTISIDQPMKDSGGFQENLQAPLLYEAGFSMLNPRYQRNFILFTLVGIVCIIAFSAIQNRLQSSSAKSCRGSWMSNGRV